METETIITLEILFIIISVWFIVTNAIKASDAQKKRIRLTENAFSNLEEFNVDQKLIGAGGLSSLAVDESRKKICFIQCEKIGITFKKQYSFKDLLECEICEDGTTITKTSRGSQIGGALLGGVLFGGTGAIIGGLSGEKTSSTKVNQLDLKIVINDTETPLHMINLLTGDFEKNPPLNSDYKKNILIANRWHALISVLIKQADEEDESSKSDSPEAETEKVHGQETFSVANEIMKLAELLDKNLITEEEFQKQKRKLLSE